MKLKPILSVAAFLLSGMIAYAQISHTGAYSGKTQHLAQDVMNAMYEEFIAESGTNIVEGMASDWSGDLSNTNFLTVLEDVYADIDLLATPGEQQAAIEGFVNDPNYFDANGNWVGSATDNLTPVVANVTAMQVEGTKNMEIFYDLSVADNQPCTITVQWSTDNGATYPLTASAVTGAAGPGIVQGVGKSIIWDMAVDWDNQFTQTGRIKIIASREVVIDTGNSSDTGDNSPTGD